MKLDLFADIGDLIATIVDIESVSGAEGELADAVENALRDVPHLTVDRNGDAVVARTDLGREQRVVLAGHLDTVPVAGNLPSRRVGERLYGCGTCDMKSGVAVQLRLAAAMTAPIRDVTYVFYDCEEVEAERNGLLRLARTRPDWLAGDFAILLEPTDGTIEGGCQGTMRVVVSTSGTRAHTARSWMGRNAIHGAGGVLDILRRYAPRRPVIDGLEYHEGLNAVAITGGVAGNVVPDRCEVAINYRFAPDRSPAEAEAYLRALFEGFDISVTDAAPGAPPGLSRGLAREFVTSVGRSGKRPRAKFGWTDVARFAENGIPAVNYGPGDPFVAHTRDEYVDIPTARECEARLAGWLTALD